MMVMPCEVWCRVTGFYRPVKSFNPGKRQEFEDRTAHQAEKKAELEAMTCNP